MKSDQLELGVFSSEFGDAPESIEENISEMSAVLAQRRNANLEVARKNDTERYLVVVYPDRAAREAALRTLGLPEDERYVLGGGGKA